MAKRGRSAAAAMSTSTLRNAEESWGGGGGGADRVDRMDAATAMASASGTLPRSCAHLFQPLAEDIVLEYFDNATWTVARTMFRFGDLKLKKLLQLTHSFETRLATPMDDAGEDGQILRDLTLDQVRCSLVQLMRHHIVTVKKAGLAESNFKDVLGVPTEATYAIDSRNAVMMLHYPELPHVMEAEARRFLAEREVLAREADMDARDRAKVCMSRHMAFHLSVWGSASQRELVDGAVVRVMRSAAVEADVRAEAERMAKATVDVDDARETFVWTVVDDDDDDDDADDDGSKEKPPTPDDMTRAQLLALEEGKALWALAEEAFDLLVDARLLVQPRPLTEGLFQAEQKRTGGLEQHIKARKDENRKKRRKKAGAAAAEGVVDLEDDDDDDFDGGGAAALFPLLAPDSALDGAAQNDGAERRDLRSAAGSAAGSAAEAEAEAEAERRALLWTPNWPLLMHIMRMDLIAEHWADSTGEPKVADVLRAAAAQSRAGENFASVDRSASSMPRCSAEVGMGSPDPSITFAAMEKMLGLTARVAQGLVTSQRRSGRRASVRVAYDGCVDRLRLAACLGHVRAVHGAEGLRLLRLVMDHGAVEESRITELAMFSPKGALAKLHELVAHGLLRLDECSKRADLNPTYTNYIYVADRAAIDEAVLRALLQDLLNLRLRYRAYTVHNATQMAGVEAQSSMAARPQRTVVNHDRWVRYRRALDHLDQAVLNVVQTLRLFTCFMPNITQMEAFARGTGVGPDDDE